MTYSLLSELDTTRDNWLVRVRVCRMWEFRNYRRDNEMISLDMVLIAEKREWRARMESGERDFLERDAWQTLANVCYGAQFNQTLATPFILGELTFATIAASKTYVNLPMDITSLIQKFATKIVYIQSIDSANAGNIPLDEAMFANTTTVTELLDSDWCCDIEDKEKMEDPSQAHVQNAGPSQTNYYIENVDVGEDTSSSNIKLYSRTLKKRRKFLIDTEDEGKIDHDNNKNPT
ncbi:hypothetical protein EJD97_004975 [Solanum chilense]|uniref:Uncharacterized protein n=1 Tax=Solanum chilense TaxID=4083 RepID=A0A6N2CDR4_SOLCI|nr:hypothetical protein EJD97_004975 [Solanum chilense]